MIAGRPTYTAADCRNARLALAGQQTRIAKLNGLVQGWPANVAQALIHEQAKCQLTITHLHGITCEWCGGRGHETEKCATKYRLAAEAKAAGITWDIGALKGLCWDPQAVRTAESRLDDLEARISTLGKRQRRH